MNPSAAVGLFILTAAVEVNGFLPSNIQTRNVFSPMKMERETRMALSNSAKSAPQLVVFDLDNTVWTPELYTLRPMERARKIPKAGIDINLFPGAKAVMEMKKSGLLPDVKFGVASRTQCVSWAHDLLDQFGIRNLFDYVEIFPGSKTAHFAKLQASSGIPFRDMLFFDDARDGKYGNCEPVADLGVMSVHCPNGLVDISIFENAMLRYSEWDGTTGTIVEASGTVTTKKSEPKKMTGREMGIANVVGRQRGIVKSINIEKRYGFLRGTSDGQDIFFHFSSLASNTKRVKVGDMMDYTTGNSTKTHKTEAVDIQLVESDKTSSNEESDETVTCRAFSLNLPFAALLTNKYKTLESRNGTMFVPYPEGTVMLVHVGGRTYPDGDRHLEIMKSGGLSDERIVELKALPKGFGRGMVVAICELGRTYETTVEERKQPDIQRKIGAYGEDSGKMITEIKRVDYLKRPVVVSALGGVFDVHVDPSIIPDGWSLKGSKKRLSGMSKAKKPLPEPRLSNTNRAKTPLSGSKTKVKKSVASISGYLSISNEPTTNAPAP